MEIKSPKVQSFALRFRLRSNGKTYLAKYPHVPFEIFKVTIEYGGFYDECSKGPIGSLTIFGNKEAMPWDLYSDEGIEETLLKAIGGRFNIKSLGWSEQGMQNDGAWNFDVTFSDNGFQLNNP